MRFRNIQTALIGAGLSLMLVTSGAIAYYAIHAHRIASRHFFNQFVYFKIQNIYQKTHQFMDQALEDADEVKILMGTMRASDLLEQSNILTQYFLLLISRHMGVDNYHLAFDNGSALTVSRLSKREGVLGRDQHAVYKARILQMDNNIIIRDVRFYDVQRKLIQSNVQRMPLQRKNALQAECLTFDARKTPWYQGAINTFGTFWSHLYFYELGEQSAHSFGFSGSSTFYHPESNQRQGVLACELSVNRLVHFLNNFQLDIVQNIWVINQEGFIIAQTTRSKRTENKSKTNLAISHDAVSVNDVPNNDLKRVYRNFSQGLHMGLQTGQNSAYTQSHLLFSPIIMMKLTSNWTLAIQINQHMVQHMTRHITMYIIIFGAFMVLLAGTLLWIIARRLSRPIVNLSHALQRLSHLDFKKDNLNSEQSSFIEVKHMQNSMACLTRDMNIFSRFMPQEIIQKINWDKHDVRYLAEKHRMSVMFCDIQGFSSISERLLPEALFAHLSEYFQELSDIIDQHNGLVDKYIGDAIMALWGAPHLTIHHANVNHANDATLTCAAALHIQKRLHVLNHMWQGLDKPPLYTRIGIGTGHMLVGALGSHKRLQYTALGNIVNLASRLEGLNNIYGTAILVNESTYQEARHAFVFRPVDRVAVRGKTESAMVFELMMCINAPEIKRDDLVEHDDHEQYLATSMLRAAQTRQAWNAYSCRQWNQAHALYENLHQSSDDALATLMMQRCASYIENPPESTWDGIYRFQK